MFLTGKHVLITGASRGIGRAIALRLAREQPAHLVVGYCMDHRAAQETVDQLHALGVPASPLAADVGRLDSLEKMFDDVAHRLGRLDVFVSNAARAAFRTVQDLSPKSWERTLDLNARAFLIGGRLAAGLMRGRGGRIVGVSSLGAHRAAPGYVALAAAKAALEAVARSMAVEFAADGINVNVACGGLIDTESVRRHPESGELFRRVAERTPEGRVGRPEDLAGVVAFLCGPDAAWVRGQTIVADGGYSIAS